MSLTEAARAVLEIFTLRPDIHRLMGPKEHADIDALGIAVAKEERAPPVETIAVSGEAYDEVVRALNEPNGPTEAALAGAEMLRSFPVPASGMSVPAPGAPGKSAEERADQLLSDLGLADRHAGAFPGDIRTVMAAFNEMDRAGYERGCRETCAAGMRALTETKP